MQLPLWTPDSDWRPPAMEDLPSWAGAKRICIDCETRDQYLKQLGIGVRRGGYITGVSFAIEDGPKHYLPMRHEGGDNLDVDQVLAYLREQGANFKGEIVGAHLPYDLDYLWEQNIYFPQVEYYRDIQIADPLIDELQFSYSLDKIAKRHGLEGKDESLLKEAAAAYGVDPKGGMWRLPARFVGAYAEQDVDQPLKVLRRQERIIDDRDLWEIYNLESQVLPVLVRMRRRGVLIDQDKLAKIEDWSLKEEAKALETVHHETGVKINVGDVWKGDALVPALEHIGLTLTTTASGKKSVSKDVFASIDHPVTKALAWARKTNKLRTTFATSVRTYMANGRVHCTFNQIAQETESGDQKGARYGRLSATDPNLQQQPSRDEFAPMWRSIYKPEPGTEWASCDYSQQEPRWTTHFAAVMDLEGARAAAQAYHDDPTLDNHQFMADLTGLPRKHAKNVYLGLCYGEGGAKLCDDLGGLPKRWALSIGRKWPRQIVYFDEDQHEAALDEAKNHEKTFLWLAAGEEGQRIIDKFDERAPFIRQAAKRATKRAEKVGQVVTICGRQLHFKQRDDGSYQFTHKAFNRVIQGSSADQMKKAMVEIDRCGYWMMLQVHDETANSVESRKQAEEIAEIQSNILPARVPFVVDVEIGPSWGEAK